MIGQIFFGLWVAAITVGAILLGQGTSDTGASEVSMAHGGSSGDYRYFETDLLGIPYVHDGKVAGYFLGRFTVKANRAAEQGYSLPVENVATDAINRHVADAADSVDEDYGWRKLTASIQEVPARINEAAGRELVAEVYVEQLDFFDKDAVRMPQEAAAPPTVQDDG